MKYFTLTLTLATNVAMAEPAIVTLQNTLPRTESEQVRIETITTPTKDFSKPEAFEARPAGAATPSG